MLPRKTLISKRLKSLIRFGFLTTMVFLLISVLQVIVYKFVTPPHSSLMYIRLFDGKSKKKQVKHQWVSYENISKNIKIAVIASEDQLYLKHNGFSIEAMKRAMKNNKSKKKKTMKGGSTISQQTAKNIFLYPERTYFRKGLEVFDTFLIEIIWGKERILEVYLNCIEMGHGIYGIEAASQAYFKKSASKLSKSEAARIAAVLPNPRRFSATNASAYILKRQNWIERQMRNLGISKKF